MFLTAHFVQLNILNLLRNVCTVDDNACSECLELDIHRAIVLLLSGADEPVLIPTLDLALVLCARPAAPFSIPGFPSAPAREADAFRASLVRAGLLPPLLRLLQSVFDDLCPENLKVSGPPPSPDAV